MDGICGFSFGRNLVKLSYPIVESVRSVLPICDRFLIAVGKSEDRTRELVESIDPKVEIIDTEWPDMKVDGEVLSVEANKALDAATATGCQWGLYIQADEVVHENDLAKITAACRHWAPETRVKALLFRYLHFVLDYQSTDPWAYHKASRIVRLDGTCHIVGDACGPALKEFDGARPYLDKHHLGAAVEWAQDPTMPGAATIFHYGWVKTRQQLDEKFQMVQELWWGTLDEDQRRRCRDEKFGDLFAKYSILKNFSGGHPSVMSEKVNSHAPYLKRRNRWLQPRFYAAIMQHGFHG